MSKTDNTRPAKFGGRECCNRDPNRHRFKGARESMKWGQRDANKRLRARARTWLNRKEQPPAEHPRSSVHWEWW